MSLLSGVIRPNQIGRLQVSSRPRSLRGFWSLSIPRSTRSGNAAAVLCRTRHWIRLSIVTEFGESSFWRLKHSFLPLVTNGKKTTTHFVGLPTRFWGSISRAPSGSERGTRSSQRRIGGIRNATPRSRFTLVMSPLLARWVPTTRLFSRTPIHPERPDSGLHRALFRNIGSELHPVPLRGSAKTQWPGSGEQPVGVALGLAHRAVTLCG